MKENNKISQEITSIAQKELSNSTKRNMLEYIIDNTHKLCAIQLSKPNINIEYI